MNTKIIFFFFFALQFFVTNAQESYFKRYPNLEDLAHEVVQSINKIDDEHIYLFSTGAFTSEDPFNWQLVTRKISIEIGEVIWKNYYTPIEDYTVQPNDVEVFNNNAFLVTGSISEKNQPFVTELPNQIFVGEFDSNGMILWYGIFGEDAFAESGLSITQTEFDEIVLLAGKSTTSAPYITKTLLYKLSSNGEVLWERQIDGSVSEMHPVSVETDTDDNIYALGDDQINLSLRQVAISKYTSDGDSLWTKYYPINGASFGKDIVRATNGNFVVSGYAGFTENNYIAPFLMEVDTSGAVVWLEDYLDEVNGGFAGRIIRTNDGGYATCLDKNGVTLLVTNEKGRATFIKNYDFGVRNPVDLLQLTDGSYMMTGIIVHPPDDDNYDTIWLIKTDPLGNVTSTAGVEVPHPFINIYPNPATDNINVSLPTSTAFAKKYQLRLVNSLGAILSEIETSDTNTAIDVSSLEDGIYYLNIFQDKLLIGSKKIVKQ